MSTATMARPMSQPAIDRCASWYTYAICTKASLGILLPRTMIDRYATRVRRFSRYLQVHENDCSEDNGDVSAIA